MAAVVKSSSAPKRAHLRPRRDLKWIVAGVLAMVLGALGTWTLFTSASNARPVLKVVHTIYRGQAITEADLATVNVGRDVELSVVPSDRARSLVGQYAKTDLPGGSLLVDGSVGSSDLAEGFARVGVKLEAGRLPATPLPAGTAVQVVALPAPATAGQPAAALPPTVDALVASANPPSADGSTLITLTVPVTYAEQVARLAAQKQVVVVQKGGTRP